MIYRGPSPPPSVFRRGLKPFKETLNLLRVAWLSVRCRCEDHIQKDAEIAKLNCNFIKKNKLHKFMYEQYRQNKKYIQNENGVFLARLSNATLLLLYCSFDEIKIIQKLECGVDGVPFSQSKWLSMDWKRNDHYFSPDAGKFKWEVECYIPITSRLYRVYV